MSAIVPLSIISYLNNKCQKKNIYELINHFSLHYGIHPSLPLIVLNYDVLKSARHHSIVDECRGIVLEFDNNTFIKDKYMKFTRIIAKGFNRFYNDIGDEKIDVTEYVNDNN